MEPLFSLLRSVAAALLTLVLTALAAAALLRGGLPMMQKGAPFVGGVTTALSALALVLLWSQRSRRYLASSPQLQALVILAFSAYFCLLPDHNSQVAVFGWAVWYSLGVVPALAVAAWTGLTEKFIDEAASLAGELGLRVVNHWYMPGVRGHSSVKRAGLAGEASGRRFGARVSYRPDPVVEFATNLAAPCPIEMHVYEDSFGNTPLFRGVKQLEPAPWPGFRLFTNDSAAAAEFARFLALSDQDLRSLVKGASWVIGPEQVRWSNVQSLSPAELKRQMELVARAARWLEARAKADPPAPNEV